MCTKLYEWLSAEESVVVLPKFLEIEAIEPSKLDAIGYTWQRDEDGEYVVRDKLITVSLQEAKAYEEAANRLYEMYEAGAEYVITNRLYEKLDIMPTLIKSIEQSWKSERDNHLYGRFDLSGGIDGKPIKLIEFNADTPTLLVESCVAQWMLLQHANLENSAQFNTIYEAIEKKFLAISKSKKGMFSKFLFSSIEGVAEEVETTKLLEKMAKDAGLVTHYSSLETLAFSENGTVLDEDEHSYDFWFKLYPWEEMADQEVSLQTTVLNPAYTLLYQSKGMLAILYELFPDSPYLLEASFEPLDCKYVKKSMFGREGANIDIVENDKVLKHCGGIYGEYKDVYQAYSDFVQDKEHKYYQAGIFYSGYACGLSFRRGAEILDDMSEFVGHCVQ